jgi:phosphohistidine phosphatase
MKRELVLIRHTKSSWGDLSLSDFDRPLKKERTDDAKRMATKLKELKLLPDLILCSPAMRTRQTAEFFCKKLGYAYKKVVFDKRIYETTERELLEVIRETEAAVKTLIVIGHNPSIPDFACSFNKTPLPDVPTTGVVWLEFENNDWEIYKTTPCRLLHFLTPKTI